VGHKADTSFFDKKREWSERKDEILRCYLPPYLAKIATLGAPILIVDAFAGPGVFGDGKDGSPLIICHAVKEALSSKPSMTVSVMCIEPLDELFLRLESNMSEFSFAEAMQGEFLDYVDVIEERARSHSVFLYVDPWQVKGLDWSALEMIFRHLTKSKMSIEILMNFNASVFARAGLAALKLTDLEPTDEIEDVEPIDPAIITPPSIEKLNSVVGGDWWQAILKTEQSFPDKVEQVARGVLEQLSRRFQEVCQHGLKAQPHHTVPKYYLIFASRHCDALELMNDQMVKSQRTLADIAKPEHPTLFEMRSTELIPDLNKLPSLILEQAAERKTRRKVIISIIRQRFGMFARREIRGCVKRLLEEGKLKSSTGRTRINDDVEIWAL